MATNQRMMTFVLNVQNEDGVAKTKEFRRAVADVDDTVELLNSTLADNVTVTAKVVQSEKDAVAQARMVVTQQQRQIKAVNSVVEQFNNYSKMAKMSADSQQVFNAQVAAGVDPLSKEGRQIAYTVRQYQALRDAQNTTVGSMRNVRGVAQNLGWQMQDVAVQLQMGTNGFIVLGQQGSQVLSSFGPAGAVAGAALAVISASIPAIITALDDASVSTEEFEKAQERLNSVIDISSAGTVTLTDDYRELYKVNKEFAELKAHQAILDSQLAMMKSTKSAKELTESLIEIDTASKNMNLPGMGTWFDQKSKGMAEELGVTVEQLKAMRRELTLSESTGNLSGLAQVMLDIRKSTESVTPKFIELAGAVNQSAFDTENYANASEILADILAGKLNPETLKQGKAIELVIEKYQRMERQLTMTDKQIAIDNYLRKEAANDSKDIIIATVKQIEAYYDEKDARDAVIKSMKDEQDLRKEQEKLLNSTTAQISHMQSSLGKSTSSYDPIGSEENKHATNFAKLRSYYDDIAKITDPAYKEDVLKEQQRINQLIEDEEERHLAAMEQAQLAQWENITSAAQMTVDSMTITVDLLSNYGASITDQMAEMNAAQEAMFLMQQAIAISNTILGGYQVAAAWENQATGIGPIAAETLAQAAIASAYVQAGTIAGFTFAGLFDKGGKIPSGSAGIVSEYGDELVNGVLVKGPATVTGREDTARIMNNTDNNSTSVGGVTVIQNISANGDKALENVARRAAQQGAQQGYNMMLNDLKSNGTGRQILRKSTGV